MYASEYSFFASTASPRRRLSRRPGRRHHPRVRASAWASGHAPFPSKLARSSLLACYQRDARTRSLSGVHSIDGVRSSAGAPAAYPRLLRGDPVGVVCAVVFVASAGRADLRLLRGDGFTVIVPLFLVASAGRADLRLLRGDGFTVIVPLFVVASAGRADLRH